MVFTDPILNQLINRYPAPSWSDRSEFLFEDLIETIISQQLSGKAAESIFKKFQLLFSSPEREESKVRGKRRYNPQDVKPEFQSFPTPEQVLNVTHETLRTVGLSNSKATYIHNVAQAFVDKLIDSEKVKLMSDEEVITALTQIKGLGRWSAEMILIFTLHRPDVFSLGDLGLRNAIKNLYGIIDKEAILTLTQTWSPNRSLASWYLWRSLENR